MGAAASAEDASSHQKFVEDLTTHRDSSDGGILSTTKLEEETRRLGLGVADCTSQLEHLHMDRPVSPLRPAPKDHSRRVATQPPSPLQEGAPRLLGNFPSGYGKLQLFAKLQQQEDVQEEVALSEPREATSHKLWPVPPSQPRETTSYRARLQHQKEILQPVPPSQPRGGAPLFNQHRLHKEPAQPLPPAQPRGQTAPRPMQLLRKQKEVLPGSMHLLSPTKDASKQAEGTAVDMPKSPGKLSTQLRQQVMMVRQGGELENSAATYEPCQGFNYHASQAVDRGGFAGTHQNSEISSGRGASLVKHGAVALQSEIVENAMQHDGKNTDATLCNLLRQATDDGSLENMLLEIKNDEVQGQSNSGRSHEILANLLIQAAQDGSLKTILSEMGQEATQQALDRIQGVNFLPQAASDGSRASASGSAQHEGVSCGSPGTAGSILLQAAHDGRLESVLSELKEEVRQDERNIARNMIATLFDVLGQAADDGSLERVLLELKNDQVQTQFDSGSPHERFSNLIMQAVRDGSLDSVLSDMNQETNPQAAVRIQGVTAPPQATNDGSQASASKRSGNEDVSCGSPEAVGRLLLQAAHDGRLQSFLSELKEDVRQEDRKVTKDARAKLGRAADVESLESTLPDIKNEKMPGQFDSGSTRERFASLLTQAVQDGSLHSILSDMKQEITQQPSGLIQGATVQAQATNYEMLASASERAENGDVSCGPAGVWGVLLQAVHDGRLGSVLSELKDEARLDDRRNVNDTNAKLSDLQRCAADDVSLKNILPELTNDTMQVQSDSGSTRERFASLLTQAVQDGSLERILSEMKQETTEQPSGGVQGCANFLTQAFQNENSESILSEIKQDGRFDYSNNNTEQGKVGIFDLLGQAAADGSLGSMLLEIKNGTVREQGESSMVCERASHLLVQAMHDGRLEGILGELAKERVQQGLDITQGGDLHLLSQAAFHWSRGNILHEDRTDSSSDNCRDKASSLLVQALHDGSLESVLSELSAETQQDRLGSCLLRAADDGTLQNLLIELKGEVRQAGKENKDVGQAKLSNDVGQASGAGSLKGMPLEISNDNMQGQWESGNIDENAADLLMQAVQKGSLKNILSEIKQETHQQASDRSHGGTDPSQAASALRQESAFKKVQTEKVSCRPAGTIDNLLMQGLHDGCLESVLRELKEETWQAGLNTLNAPALVAC